MTDEVYRSRGGWYSFDGWVRSHEIINLAPNIIALAKRETIESNRRWGCLCVYMKVGDFWEKLTWAYLSTLREKHGFQNEDFFNADKIKFFLGTHRLKKIVKRTKDKSTEHIDLAIAMSYKAATLQAMLDNHIRRAA